MNPSKYRRIVIGLFCGGLLAVGVSVLLSGAPQIAWADPGDHFVTPGGSGDCSQATPCDLPTALGLAVDTDSIYLGEGTYTGFGGAVVTVTQSITLYGGWDGTTTVPPVRNPDTYRSILNGEGQRRVIYITGTIAPTFDGLIITGGDATDLGGRFDWGLVYDAGGGIYSYNADPVIVNNVITSNLGSRLNRVRGGGIYLYNGNDAVIDDNTIISNTGTLSPTDGYGGGLFLDDSAATVSDNDIINNIAAPEGDAKGGGLYLLLSDVEIIGNDVLSNTASGTSLRSGTGGGIYLRNSDAAVVSNTLTGNIGNTAGTGQGGGLFVDRSAATVSANTIQGNYGSLNGYGYGGGIRVGFSPALIEGNTVVSNTAGGGGGQGGGLRIWASRPFTLTNNLIAHNQADYGGGGMSVEAYVASNSSRGVLVNNTIVQNALGDAGEGVWIGPHCAVTLTNNIIASHTVGITNAYPASTTVVADHTLFYGNATNYGSAVGSTYEVIGRDPLFVDPSGWNYHLLFGSPAMNAGVAVPWLTTDIDGDPRPFGSAPDIGIDELIGYRSIHLPLVIKV